MQLLDALDALVLSDAQGSMLSGRIAVGVRGADGYRFWSAALGRSVTTARSDARPTGCDATLFLDAADADAILRTGRLPARPTMLYLDGDRGLLTRFLTRYAGGRQSLLGARCAAIESNRTAAPARVRRPSGVRPDASGRTPPPRP